MSQLPDEENRTFESQRGGFEGKKKSAVPGAKAFMLLLLILPMIFLVTLFLKHHSAQQAKDSQKEGSRQQVSSLPNVVFHQQPIAEPSPPAPAPEVVVAPAPSNNGELEAAVQRRLSSPLSDQNQDSERNSGIPDTSVPTTTPLGNQLDRLLTPMKMAAATAGIIKNRSLKILRGTFIPCGLTNELNTTVNGMLACRVSRDVYSADGLVKLIDKGAIIDGQVNAALKDGQKRVFVVWERIVSNDGVTIDLNSPATNQVGGAGVPGQVDTLFWQRFKSAILISMLDDAMTALVNTTQRGNVANYGTSSGGSNEIVSAVLPATIDIPPILYAHQGSAVGVYVARDLDFSRVYALAER
ncbi:type IV secretion system protein VirB10 [Rosenbergiella nectarea]|uniref:type IV secretion system protein VirB10 n=1 Tax=Rosenbergiella nectarea TaxID=988801 RepID=UPI001BDB400D|nr:TrbI/VirB10 family protein [Rosenbergiella nectarea subsp. apis]